MVRILQLCVRYPPAPGGAETHAKSLTEGLRELGHEVYVYTSDLYKEFPFTRLNNDFNSKTYVKRYKAYTLKGDLHYVFYPSLVSSLLTNDFDLYHAHSYGYFHVNTSAFLKHLKETPFVLTPHFHPEWSMWGGEKRKKIRGFYDSLIAQRVMDSVDIIIGVTRNEIKHLKYNLDIPDEKVEIIPNGINKKDFTPIPDGSKFKDKYELEGDIVLYTGRLASNKGLIDLVKTMPFVLEQNKDITFVLIGEDEGMKEEIIEKARELEVLDSLKIINYIEDYDLFKSSYAAADVYVLPSEYEAFGIVLLEAMMCETPCVGTKVGGVPEVVEDGETGLLVDYGDIERLSESINLLMEDEVKRDKMGKKGRKRVLEKFTWDKVVNQVDKVYRDLINIS